MEFEPTDKTRVRRLPARARYDAETIYAILDESLICHIGFAAGGQPFVIPTIHARKDDVLYLHGSNASRMLKHIQQGSPLCVTATLLDGLVLARSVFHHSLNYRSVVLFGKGRIVETDEEKLVALEAITEHIARGRWAEARKPNRNELNATTVVAVDIETASAKIRTGGPVDDEEDYALPVWAGVVPLELRAQRPVPDPRLAADVALPVSVRTKSPAMACIS